MPETLQRLFESIREACTAGDWSRGVELARGGAVCGEREEDGEIALRISVSGSVVSPSVLLLPEGGDWDCDCGHLEEACAHVAAGIIALRQARREGADLPSGDAAAAGRIGYRLSRTSTGLAFERVLVRGEEETALRTALAAIHSGRVAGPRFAASSDDLELESALGTRLHGDLPPGLWPSLLTALQRCNDVQLDGEAMRTSGERLGWEALLADHEGGFRLRVRPDPRIEERFACGVVRAGDLLCLAGESRLTGREREDWLGGRDFTADQAAELVGEVLPSLGKRIPVTILSKRLPRAERLPPRISLEVRRDGNALSVLPSLVYGDPACARVDAGRMVLLGDGPLPLRDEAEERQLLRGLAQQLELVPGHRAHKSGEEAIRLAQRLEAFGAEIRGDAHRAYTREPELVPHFETREGGFELHFESGTGEDARRADAGAVLSAWRDRESLLPLAGGGFAPLPSDWLAEHGQRVADLLAARDAAGKVAPALFPDLARLCEQLEIPAPPDVAALREKLESNPPSASLPDDLQAELRAYQLEGVSWLGMLRDASLGALLADDMGLGKTLQALCAMRGRTLVVAPTSVLHNWVAELRRFRPTLSLSRYHGSGRRLDPDSEVTLTTWGVLRQDVAVLAAVHWDSLVMDETQAIKNPASAVAQAAHRLHADFRVALTGTPIENRLEELWSQLHALNPGLLGSLQDFEERYGSPVAAGDPEAIAHLRQRIRPFVLRRRKREVAPELPPRTEVVLRAELSSDERNVYDAVRAAARREVVEKLASGGGVMRALEALLRLRQAACHTDLVPGQQAESSTKLALLLERLEQAVQEGHKALVFSQWTGLLDRIEPHLRRSEIDFSRLDGSTRDRGAVVDDFQRDDGPPVLLLSLRAGGVGLNLTAADCVFIVDPWWNPAVEDQAADRAHRIGQERPVVIYRLVAADTVEEGILALQARKRELGEAALGEASGGGAISRKELLDLLS